MVKTKCFFYFTLEVTICSPSDNEVAGGQPQRLPSFRSVGLQSVHPDPGQRAAEVAAPLAAAGLFGLRGAPEALDQVLEGPAAAAGGQGGADDACAEGVGELKGGGDVRITRAPGGADDGRLLEKMVVGHEEGDQGLSDGEATDNTWKLKKIEKWNENWKTKRKLKNEN